MSGSLQQALLQSGGGGNIPLLSLIQSQQAANNKPAIPPPGSNLPSYAAGSNGMTVPNAVQIQRDNPSLPWYRAPGIFQQPPPPPAPAAAAPAGPGANNGGGSFGAEPFADARAQGMAMNQNAYHTTDPTKLGMLGTAGFPLFTGPASVQDLAAKQIQAVSDPYQQEFMRQQFLRQLMPSGANGGGGGAGDLSGAGSGGQGQDASGQW